MTPQQHVDRFVAKYNGVYIDEDKYYGSQCWVAVARYAREEYGCPAFPTGSGGAEGLFRLYSQPIPQYFDKVTRDQLQPGDIVVWSSDFYPPWGHTAIVWQREGNTLFVLEQDGSKDPNGDGKADGVSYIAQRIITNKVAGGLRPKGGFIMNDKQANDLALAIGLALMFSESEINSPWHYNLAARARNIKGDPMNYPQALLMDKEVGYNSPHFQNMLWKAVHFDEEVNKAYERGKAEAGGGSDVNFIPVAAVDGVPTLFVKSNKEG